MRSPTGAAPFIVVYHLFFALRLQPSRVNFYPRRLLSKRSKTARRTAPRRGTRPAPFHRARRGRKGKEKSPPTSSAGVRYANRPTKNGGAVNQLTL